MYLLAEYVKTITGFGLKDDADLVKRCMMIETDETKQTGCKMKSWSDCIEDKVVACPERMLRLDQWK